MDKRLFIIIFILLAKCNMFAQITVINAGNHEAKNEIEQYDSLSNIKAKWEGRQMGYRHLKGQTIMCCADVLTQYPFFSKVKFGDYFQIMDVKRGNKEYDRFYVQNTKTNETFSFDCTYETNSVWILVGYYEKMKSIYVGKEYVFRDIMPDNQRCDIFSCETDSVIKNITDKTLWKCVDISVKKYSNEKIDSRSPLVMVVENSQYGKFYCSIENYLGDLFSKKIENDKYSLLCGNFQEKISYDNMINEIERENSLKAKENEQRLAVLTKKYGSKDAKLIIEGRIRIGMTKNMCIESWGRPDQINKTTTSYGTTEQWCYGLNCYVYFEGNKITAIQN